MTAKTTASVRPPRSRFRVRPQAPGLADGCFVQERQDRFLRHDAVAGVRNDTQLRTTDRPEHLDSVLHHDDIAVAHDEQGRRLDATNRAGFAPCPMSRGWNPYRAQMTYVSTLCPLPRSSR